MKTIPLTQGQVALISDADYWLVRQFNWHAHANYNNWYAEAWDSEHHITKVSRQNTPRL
jgi:hypothetical protein